ncbi:MAG: hypothetical protein CVU64_03175 [Deltaproteobacteria bacterium HGW-Deltaproteobacteria-21]|nr:MAG: hypothetical protein CVU64_03175 [Deltaproteobacteria bacterium HGW-Deltaproteobacteria-21]
MQKIGTLGKKVKPASITFKTSPKIKDILEGLAKEGFRSLSSEIEMIVIKYLEDQGIDWREEPEKKTKK